MTETNMAWFMNLFGNNFTYVRTGLVYQRVINGEKIIHSFNMRRGRLVLQVHSELPEGVAEATIVDHTAEMPILLKGEIARLPAKQLVNQIVDVVLHSHFCKPFFFEGLIGDNYFVIDTGV